MNHSSIILPTPQGRRFFRLEDIIRLEADSNYTTIHFAERKKIVSAKVLKIYEALLEPMGFVRIHQSHLVNRCHVREITTEGKIIMKDTSVVDISRRKKTRVLGLLNQ